MPENWLSPSADVWEERFGRGTFPGGMAGRQLKPLYEAGVPPDTIAAHLRHYLSQTPPQYINLTRFASTFAAWSPQQAELALGDARPLVDEYGMLTEFGLRALTGRHERP